MGLAQQDVVFGARAFQNALAARFCHRVPGAVDQPGARRVHGLEGCQVEDDAASCARGRQQGVGLPLEPGRGDGPAPVQAQLQPV